MRWVFRLLMLLVLVTVGVAAAGFFYARLSLPQMDGTIALSGLKADVKVTRDRFAVPHIYADSKRDAAFAIGFVHAQDRLWQMETQRRIGAGRLAEIFGADLLGTDKFLRTLSIYNAAERTVARLDADTLNLLEAYAAGVNSFLNHPDTVLPVEFTILGVKPEPWKVADTLVWVKMMALDLSANWASEALRQSMVGILSNQQIREVWPDYPADGPLTLADADQTPSPDMFRQLAEITPFKQVEGKGSNNWVVAGSRTATGKPLLANDPHLGLAAPALWYFAHIETPDMATIGATLPGVPMVVLGRNREIAWGFTNTGPDTQDLYIEQTNPDNPSEYRTPEGWAKFGTRKEIIRVKGQDQPITITVRTTRHGPVLSDATSRMKSVAKNGNVVALRWHVLDDNEMTIRAGINLNSARNWQEFRNALKDFHGAQQNIVFADTRGNIGYIAAGRVPIRANQDKWQGMMPSPGWDPAYDHVGYIPFDELPQTFNPATGYVATANQKIVGDDYPHFLTNEWAAQYRMERIKELLEGRKAHSIESFKTIQADVVSLHARRLLPILTKVAGANDQQKQILADLKIWDGTMAADRYEPTVYNAWYRQITKQILVDEVGGQDNLGEMWAWHTNFTRNVLENVDGQSRWCDDIATTGRTESCNDILQRALTLALEDLAIRYGNDPAEWVWGPLHAGHSDHRPFSKIPVLKDIFDIRTPIGGDTYTVNVSRNHIRNDDDPFATVHGPSLRAIYDMDNPDRSIYIHSTGQSGHFLSPHYSDMADRWGRVDYIPMSMARSDFEAGALGTLTLTPLP